MTYDKKRLRSLFVIYLQEHSTQQSKTAQHTRPPNCPTDVMATPSGCRRGSSHSSHDHLTGSWGLPVNGRQRRDSEVIDLTSPPKPASATATTNGFDGVALSDFSIGDRLGATRDGGQGFQVRFRFNAGCVLDLRYV